MTDLARRPLAVRLMDAAHEPDRLAIIDGERKVTIGEVVERAGSLAAAILDRQPEGTGPLAVYGARNADMVVAVLATLIAGRGFSIVEDDQPDARVAEVIRRVGGGLVVVADPGLTDRLSPEASTVALGGRERRFELTESRVPSLDEVASVVFTSGSTGRPKAVALSHATAEARADDRIVQAAERQWPVHPCHSPFSYAAGMNQVLAVVAGATIELFDAPRLGPAALSEWIRRRELVGIEMVPSLALAVARATASRIGSLRMVSSIGEGLDWSVVDELRRIASPELTIEVRYSSTEASLALRTFIRPDDPVGAGMIPLGAPYRGREVRLEPVGGERTGPAEIVVYGGALADGYWDDPELTAARFGVTDDGGRWYRTGDLATVDDDGQFFHRGRVDDLVKIRGLLVEPSESERVLRTIPGVTEAAVLVRNGEGGRPRLVCHLATDPSAAVGPAVVRRHLADHLPPHLVPSLLVHHEQLPVTERGKVDRARLGQVAEVPWRTDPVLPAVTVHERIVASVVTSVLGVGEVSLDDDIFDLGTDSLAVQEIAASIEDQSGLALAISDILEAGTISGVAACLDSAGGSGRDVTVLNPGGTRPPIVAIPGAGGTTMMFRWLAAALGPDQPLIAVQQHGMAERGRPDRSVAAAARRIDALLSEMDVDGPMLVLGHSAGGLVAYELASRRLHAGRSVALVVLLDTAVGPALTMLTSPEQVTERLKSQLIRSPARTLSWLSLGVSRRVRRAARAARVGLRAPSHRHDYGDFYDIAKAAARRYRPHPLSGGVRPLLVHVSASNAPGAWHPITDVETVEVGGDHVGMLQPPHVEGVATTIREHVDGVVGLTRRSASAGSEGS